jgi:hypothetical protein
MLHGCKSKLTNPFLLVAPAQAGGSIQGRKVWGLIF